MAGSAWVRFVVHGFKVIRAGVPPMPIGIHGLMYCGTVNADGFPFPVGGQAIVVVQAEYGWEPAAVLHVELQDVDGRALWSAEERKTIGDIGPGDFGLAVFELPLDGVRVPKPGRYKLVAWIDGTPRAEWSMLYKAAPQKKQGG